VRAGVDLAGGVKVGGSLTVTADLKANGNSDVDGGYDGGEISLGAFGPVDVSAHCGPWAPIRMEAADRSSSTAVTTSSGA